MPDPMIGAHDAPLRTAETPFDIAGKAVVVTGGAGFLGRVVCQKLDERGAAKVIVPRSAEYDLTTEDACRRLYADHTPDAVIHLAAEVGGIGANRDNPGRYCFANMAMAMNLIEQGRAYGLHERCVGGGAGGGTFVQVGTICAYPKFAPIPFKEETLWDGYPEETNAPYGVAKKAAMVMLDGYAQQYGFRSSYVLPVNLYGPNDNFNLHSSHVIPALIRKCVEAMDRGDDHIVCWGTGSASREFLYVDDAAEGIVRAAERMDRPIPINLGASFEITIKDLVELIARLTGFAGEGEYADKIRWDATKPDGQPRRKLDTGRARQLLGWQSEVSFEDGLTRTIEWFREHRTDADARL